MFSQPAIRTAPIADEPARRRDRALYGQLRWFVRLRWGAGLAVLLGALVDALLGDAPGWRPAALAGVGGVIGLYNIALWWPLRRPRRASGPLMVLAGAQIVLDLACLSLLVAWTGGTASPLLGFFVFHMVFASLLLPRPLAYAAAAIALALLSTALAIMGIWPSNSVERMTIVGWTLSLVGTVFVANHITRSLKQHRLRLLSRNRRIRQMSRQIRRHQKALIQHEKMAAMGQMAAGVAHEIANPLANLDSVLQLIRRQPDRASAQRLATLAEQTERIGQIIQQMTDFAHPTQMQWQELTLDQLVEPALRMVRFDRRHKQITIDHEPSPAGCRVRVQPLQCNRYWSMSC